MKRDTVKTIEQANELYAKIADVLEQERDLEVVAWALVNTNVAFGKISADDCCGDEAKHMERLFTACRKAMAAEGPIKSVEIGRG